MNIFFPFVCTSFASLRRGTQVPTPIAASPSGKSPGKRDRKKARARVMNLRIFFNSSFVICWHFLLLMLLNNVLLLLMPRVKTSGTGEQLQDAACEKGPRYISDLHVFLLKMLACFRFLQETSGDADERRRRNRRAKAVAKAGEGLV